MDHINFLGLFVVILIILVFIFQFCKNTGEYIYIRLTTNNNNNNNNNNNSINYNKSLIEMYNNNNINKNTNINNIPTTIIRDIDKWVKKNNVMINSGDNDEYLCKTRVIQVPEKDKDDDTICNKLSQTLCDNRIPLTKITVPENTKISFHLDSGVKLVNGQSYCMYKPPPPLLSSSSSSSVVACNEVWGFWQFSQKYEHWMCKSKVPGIYNASKNKFDACKPGVLVFDSEYVSAENISRQNPEWFYSTEYQNRFACDCPSGYVFREDLSRTTCFKDPCLSLLPVNPLAKGYVKDTGYCDCGPYFYNIDINDPKSICTACPPPIYDDSEKTLKIHIKCGDGEMFPCTTSEEKIKGCKEAVIKAKPTPTPQTPLATRFEDLVFF